LKFRNFIPAIIWFFIILVLLLIPGSDIPKEPFLTGIYFDKWVHITLFAVCVFLFCLPFINYLKHYSPIFILIAVLGWIYGIAMEFVQKYFASNRSFEIKDIIADGTGCLVGYLMAYWLAKRKALQNKNKPG